MSQGTRMIERMFATDTQCYDTTTPDHVEQRLATLEALIASLRAEQIRLLRRADLGKYARNDGSRSLQEWTASRLDIPTPLARDLVHAARHISDTLEDRLDHGEITFDRAVATSRLVAAGAPSSAVDASAGFDIAGVRRLAARHRQMTPAEEREVFEERYARIDLNVDNTRATLRACLPGIDAETITQAIHEWADRIPLLPDGTRDTLAHRKADALVAICQNALHPTTEAESASRGPNVLLTVDLLTLAESRGTAGVEVVGGARVGINALDEALCNGSVSLDVSQLDGTILGVGSDADPIPPRVRRHVLTRDVGCAADGCDSRYRCQVHHIVPRSQGGDNDPTNLVALCWYHHHVVVHGKGYTIDPKSPPQRRRFLPPEAAPDPPIQ